MEDNVHAYQLWPDLKVKYPDEYIQKIFANIKPALDLKSYDYAFRELFNQLKPYSPDPQGDWSAVRNKILLCTMIFLFGILIGYVIRSVRNNTPQHKLENISIDNKLCPLNQLSNDHQSDDLRDECPICLEKIDPLQTIMTKQTDGYDEGLLECNHRFHAVCLNSWLSEDKNCPLCQKRLTHMIIIN